MARKALSPLLLFICTPTTINNTGHPVDERRNGVLVVCWPSLGLLLVGTVSGTFYTNLSATITTAVLPEYNLPPNLSMALDENAAYFLSGVLRVLRTTRYNTCQKYTTPIHHTPICRLVNATTTPPQVLPCIEPGPDRFHLKTSRTGAPEGLVYPCRAACRALLT